MLSDVHLLELAVGGALSAAKAAPIMAIMMKMRRILKLDELCLDYGNIKCEMVLTQGQQDDSIYISLRPNSSMS